MRLARITLLGAVALLASCGRKPVPAAPTGDLTVALVSEFEAQVNNGGFDQFFLNSSGGTTEETIAALEKIGAHKTSEILRQAAAKFPSGSVPRDSASRQEQLSKISPEGKAFEESDRAFYKYEDDLAALMKAYPTREKR